MKYSIFFIFLILSAAACKQEDKKPLLLGDWQAVSWKVGDKESGRDVASVSFHFNTDDTYAAAYGDQREVGSFRLTGNKLYTTADAANKIEKMVELDRLTADTLVMNMNRVGTPETLVLVKRKN